jgi:hypothetical protein
MLTVCARCLLSSLLLLSLALRHRARPKRAPEGDHSHRRRSLPLPEAEHGEGRRGA